MDTKPEDFDENGVFSFAKYRARLKADIKSQEEPPEAIGSGTAHRPNPRGTVELGKIEYGEKPAPPPVSSDGGKRKAAREALEYEAKKKAPKVKTPEVKAPEKKAPEKKKDDE